MKVAGPPPSCKIYTPSDLATAIVGALGDARNAMWLEPSHGKGAFLEAVSCLGVESTRIVAVDLDVTVSPADGLATTFRGVDFLRWARQRRRTFDRIVGNPPFIQIGRLPKSLQKSAASVVDMDGHPIGKGSNLWSAFVLASLALLRPNGCLAFVLPAAAEFADYSMGVRRAVARSFGSLELYQCARPLFDDVQEGTLVAMARGFGAGPCSIRRRRFGSREALISGLSESSPGNGHGCPRGIARARGPETLLGSVATIRLGGVTGDAAFFLMNDQKRKALGLPIGALRRVISRARHLRSAALAMNGWEELKKMDERVWLFNPPDTFLKNPKVAQYLKFSATEGGCNRRAYKVAVRNPWYRTQMPRTPDAFLSGMSQHGPWLCINETERVNATNTLYVVSFASRRKEDWYMWSLALQSSHAQRQIRRLGRRYADGLIKHEPGSFNSVALPPLKRNVDYKAVYHKVVEAILEGNVAVARKIADAAVLQRAEW